MTLDDEHHFLPAALACSATHMAVGISVRNSSLTDLSVRSVHGSLQVRGFFFMMDAEGKGYKR